MPPFYAGDEPLPDAGIAALAQGVFGLVPGVEVPHHVHFAGVGRPDGEIRTFFAADYGGVGAELFIQPQVVALVKEVNVLVGYELRVVRF